MNETTMGMILLAAMMTAAMSTSYYPVRLEDPAAVVLTAPNDGVADATAAIQRAIDSVPDEGIVFVPSGRYRISDTLRIWPGIRVIGYGATRPTFLLADKTTGYDGSEKLMVFFAGWRPGNGEKLDLDHPSGQGFDLGYPNDANPGTFYSAMSNVDLEVGEGNPGAVGVRAKYAQHCYLAHMDFRLGSALAGIHETGNVGEDLHFIGGKYGIITHTPSPGWPYTLLDSTFEGQSVAAIWTSAAGLTLIRPTFRKVPTAVEVEPEKTEQLWMSDARLEDISGPAIVISREKSLRTQINFERVSCRNVPVFASFRESGKTIGGPSAGSGTRDDGRGSQPSPFPLPRGEGSEAYVVKSFAHGLTFATIASDPEVTTQIDAHPVDALPAAATSDIAALPDSGTWVNLRSLGAKGDGETDDTAVLKAAIAKYPTIYLPSGKYRVTESIVLRPDTVLIGLHPFTTQILIKDRTPAFAGKNGFSGPPVPLLETPKGGHNIVTGIGLDTGGNNPAAVAARWMAGKDSMLQDVKFLGGHGSVPWEQIYNANHSGDPNPSRRWDSQYASLWVTDGGGGTFSNIWTASTFAKAGMEVSNTTTEGRVYEMSTEHHVRNEVQLRNASNWSFYGLQAEEERGEGPFALPLEIDSCSNVLIANLNIYRVISMEQPFPYAVKVANSKDVRLRNIHCNSNSKASFDSLLFDATSRTEVRQREFASLTVGEFHRRGAEGVGAGEVRKLAGGFFNISGGAVDAKGDYYFVDARFHRIYRCDAASEGLSTVADSPLAPVNLFFDASGNLNVVSYAGKGTVYSFKPGSDDIAVLAAEPAAAQPGKTYVLPVTDFDLNGDLISGKPLRRSHFFASPDGTTLLPVDQDFLDGDTSWGVKSQAVIRSFGLAKAKPGQTFYTSGENNSRTYSATVGEDGSLLGGKLFAERGGEGVAVDAKGNVYLADGQIYVYDPHGKPIRTIRVPERPTQVLFGGPDGKTLFIAARTGLYSVRL